MSFLIRISLRRFERPSWSILTQLPHHSPCFPDSKPLLGMLYSFLKAQRALYDATILPLFSGTHNSNSTLLGTYKYKRIWMFDAQAQAWLIDIGDFGYDTPANSVRMISIGVGGMGWHDTSKSYELAMGMDELMYL